MRRSLVVPAGAIVLATTFGLGYVVGEHADQAQVPNLVGLGTQHGGQAEAHDALAAVGLRVGKVGIRLCTPDELGLVVHQSVPAGTSVPKESTVNISIGDDGTHLIGVFGTPDPCLAGEQHPAGQPSEER
jgi:beta-lactam-binding protein with PASTA domain